MENQADMSGRAGKIDAVLAGIYPPTTALEFTSPFTLLVAAVLAAQCTDERVNIVTKTLFGRYPDPASFASATLGELEEAVHSTGFYKQKAATLKKLGEALQNLYGGKVPETVEELLELPGIGRKTANLVLGNSMGKNAVFVDTHVKRLSARMGFTANTDPDKIEADLVKIIKPERQTAFSNLLTRLGRDICTARKAHCERCPVAHLCPKVGV